MNFWHGGTPKGEAYSQVSMVADPSTVLQLPLQHSLSIEQSEPLIKQLPLSEPPLDDGQLPGMPG